MNTREALQALLEGKKIRKGFWNKSDYIFLNHNAILTNTGVATGFDPVPSICPWEIYKEPKEMKRFWLWNLKHKEKPWYKCSEYLDDNGMYISGKHGTIRHELEKQKLENEFIDIEWGDE